jgi:hypothetical protein
MLTEAVYGDGFIKLADGCDGGHQVWLAKTKSTKTNRPACASIQ